MKRPKIFITHWVHEEIIKYLADFGEVVTNQTPHSLPKAKLLEHARDAQAIMTFMPDSVNEDFLSHCEELKIIGAALKGYDNYDVDACTRKGVWISYVPDHLTVPTAELAIGHMIAIGRNMQCGDRLIRNGQFPGWRPVLYGRGLAGSTVGILGMGEVGRAIAQMLVPFSCKTIYYDVRQLDASLEDELRAEYTQPIDIYKQSHFLVIALPLNDTTAFTINEESLALCRPDCYLINIGRGSCVDEAAVAKALERDELAGYGADVFGFEDWIRGDKPETIPASLLGNLEKTFFTPHIGSAVDSVRKDIAMEAAINIVEALQGKKPHGALNQV